MEKEMLVQWLEKRMEGIKKHALTVKPGFFPESIHQFRTETKKLRAMLRLAGTESEKDFSLPKRFHRLYHAGGAVRDSQMQLQALAADKRHTLPEFTTWLAHSAALAERQWRRVYSEAIVQELEEEVSAFPAAPPDITSLLLFFTIRLDKLRTLMNEEPDDDALHEVRKLSKDMGYVLHACKADWPEAWLLLQRLEKAIDRLSERAGLYNDRRNMLDALDRFGREYGERLESPEAAQVARAAADWASAKTKERHSLIVAIRQLTRGRRDAAFSLLPAVAPTGRT